MQEKDYQELKKHARRLCYSAPHLSHEDILHDAIIETESSEIHVVKKKIYSLFKDRLHNVRSLKTDQKFSKGETTRVCKKCHEELPIGCFYMVVRKRTNTHEILYNCKECQKKVTAANAKKNPVPRRRCQKRWQDKRKKIPAYAEKEKQRMKKYHQENREARLKKMKEYSKKRRQQLQGCG